MADAARERNIAATTAEIALTGEHICTDWNWHGGLVPDPTTDEDYVFADYYYYVPPPGLTGLIHCYAANLMLFGGYSPGDQCIVVPTKPVGIRLLCACV